MSATTIQCALSSNTILIYILNTLFRTDSLESGLLLPNQFNTAY